MRARENGAMTEWGNLLHNNKAQHAATLPSELCDVWEHCVISAQLYGFLSAIVSQPRQSDNITLTAMLNMKVILCHGTRGKQACAVSCTSARLTLVKKFTWAWTEGRGIHFLNYSNERQEAKQQEKDKKKWIENSVQPRPGAIAPSLLSGGWQVNTRWRMCCLWLAVLAVCEWR